jgi:hypothetical protein
MLFRVQHPLLISETLNACDLALWNYSGYINHIFGFPWILRTFHCPLCSVVVGFVASHYFLCSKNWPLQLFYYARICGNWGAWFAGICENCGILSGILWPKSDSGARARCLLREFARICARRTRESRVPDTWAKSLVAPRARHSMVEQSHIYCVLCWFIMPFPFIVYMFSSALLLSPYHPTESLRYQLSVSVAQSPFVRPYEHFAMLFWLVTTE